jgi:hypothetical protein
LLLVVLVLLLLLLRVVVVVVVLVVEAPLLASFPAKGEAGRGPRRGKRRARPRCC